MVIVNMNLKLFNEVMCSNLKDISVFDDCVIWDLGINLDENGMYLFKYGDRNTIIEIEVLMVKCKIWAIANNICISSGNGMLKNDGFYCSVDGFMPIEEYIAYADTEHEAVFDACNYLLK